MQDILPLVPSFPWLSLSFSIFWDLQISFSLYNQDIPSYFFHALLECFTSHRFQLVVLGAKDGMVAEKLGVEWNESLTFLANIIFMATQAARASQFVATGHVSSTLQHDLQSQPCKEDEKHGLTALSTLLTQSLV